MSFEPINGSTLSGKFADQTLYPGLTTKVTGQCGTTFFVKIEFIIYCGKDSSCV